MPNPRAQRQLTLDRVVSDLKSFAEPAQAMGDMMAGALRGSVAATSGLGGDISEIGRAVAPDTMQSVFGRRVMPTTEEMNKMLPSAVPQNASASRKHTAETFGALGEFMPTPMSGTAAKALSYGLGRGAGALTRGAGKMVNDAMVYNQGPLAKGSLSFLAPRTATMNVVKPEGGNWTGGAMMNSVENNLNRLKVDPVLDYKNRIELAEKKLSDPNLNEEGRDVVQQRINGLKSDLAINNWVSGNLGNYVKNKMATVNDPVRLMFEKRVQDVESKYAKDIERSERIRERAQQETDPRRQANLMREANTLMHEAEAGKDLAMRHITHLPDADIDEAARHRPSQETQEQRYRAGFKMLGEAESAPARAWENMSDMGVEERRAGDIQETMGLMPKVQEAERAYLDHLEMMDNNFRKFLADKNVLKDSEIESLVDKMSWPGKAAMIGDTEWEKLRSNMFQLQAKVQGGNWHTGEKNPWIAKLDPEATLYSGDIAHLGFDHVVDILKQDLRAGRIRPEQLNKITVDQAIQRTAEFDMEQAKKMAETQIKQTEGMPIHKEYPEGYKWIELAEPKMPESWKLPEGYILKKDERAQNEKSPWFVYGPNGEVVSGKKGLFHATPEQAIENVYSKDAYKTLEDALKYEGDTMGHCVGGYCPDVVEGKSRIYSLRDMRGEPHVTVEVKPDSYYPYGPPHANILENMEVAKEQAIAQGLPTDYDTLYSISTDLLKKNTSPSIVQIKGKQNKAPKEQYLPYVQDFVRGGNWSDVGDIKNTGLLPLTHFNEETVNKIGLKLPKYLTEQEKNDLNNFIYSYKPEHGLPNEVPLPESLQKFRPPPETGMKKGGKVSISNNCDCQHMEVMDKHMAGGGALSKAAIEALERMKALKPEFQAKVNLQNKYKAETVGLPYNEVKPLQMTNEQIREEMDRMAKSQKLVNTIKSGEQMLNYIVATDPAKEALKNDKMTNYIKSRKFSEKTIDPSKLPSIDDIYAIENDLYGRVLMPDEYKVKDYKDRIKAGSMPPAIVMDEFGNILDGQHRAIAAREANVPIKAYVPEQSKGKGGAVEKLIKLARAPAKTKAEIEAIAQRIAPQMTGEYVRASDKTAKTVAGKTQKQFEREKTLEHDIRPTDGERPLPKDVDIESLKGNVMMGISGDPTITGQTIYSINGVPLRSPAPQHGGPLYGLGKEDEFWASNLGAAQGVQNRAKGLSELYESPVVGNYVKMGPDSYSYAQHFADTNMQNIHPELMTKKQIEGFNKLVRQGSLKSGPRPSFPGIENPEEAYLHFAVDPELRKHFGNLMQMPTVTEKFGLPSGQDVAHAVTEPDLRNLEIGVTGKSLGLMKPDVTDLKLSSHPTYSHDIPGQFLGGMKYPVPHDLMFPDTLKSVRENPAQAPQEFGSFKMVGPRQVIDQQMIDEIKQYQDMIKKYTGKKKGGKVKKMAEGGEITGDDLIIEERPL